MSETSKNVSWTQVSGELGHEVGYKLTTVGKRENEMQWINTLCTERKRRKRTLAADGAYTEGVAVNTRRGLHWDVLREVDET